MRTRNALEKRNPEAFALSLERLFGTGLAAHGVRPYLVRHRLPSPESVHIEIVLHSAFDLPLVERFIEEQFVRVTGNPDEERPSAFRDLSPIESTLRLDPVRQNLPEWRDFAETPFLVTINTLFGEAFRAALSYLSRTERKEGLHQSRETLLELYELAKQLDSSFSQLFSSFEKTEQELVLPESFQVCGFQEQASPEDQPLPRPEAGLLPEEAAAFLSGRNTMLERLVLIAEENGLALKGPLPPFNDVRAIKEAEGFQQLVAELGKQKLETSEKIEEFFLRKLSDWEDLYASFELARLKGLLSQKPVSLLKLVSFLVQSVTDI